MEYQVTAAIQANGHTPVLIDHYRGIGEAVWGIRGVKGVRIVHNYRNGVAEAWHGMTLLASGTPEAAVAAALA